MEIITIESKAFKEIIDQIGILSNYIQSTQANKERNEDNEWVDNYEVCTFLKISERTLQRLRTNGEISFSRIRGRNYYKLSEIRRMLDDKLIRSKKEYLDDLINHHSQTRKQKGKKKNNIYYYKYRKATKFHFRNNVAFSFQTPFTLLFPYLLFPIIHN